MLHIHIRKVIARSEIHITKKRDVPLVMRQDLAAFLTVLPHKTLVQYVRAELRKRAGVQRELTNSLPCY